MARCGGQEAVSANALSAKRKDKGDPPGLGYFARQARPTLDDLRLEPGRLDEPLPLGDQGGTLRVELNHSDPSVLPDGFRLGDNDTRILSVARWLSKEGKDVVLVSKDLPLRVKAASVGLAAEEDRAELAVVESGWTGMRELELGADQVEELYDSGRLDLEEARELPCHSGLRLLSGRGSALGRVQPAKSVRLVPPHRRGFGVHAPPPAPPAPPHLLFPHHTRVV